MLPTMRDLALLIMQFLAEHDLTETLHKLEQESGFYFNMKYFEEEVLNGNWDEVEKYLSGFTKVDDNEYSRKIFFEIRKHKYLEALDNHDWTKAHGILKKDLKVFAAIDEDLFKELTQLLVMDNFRANKELANFPDNKSARIALLIGLKKLIAVNPLLHDKLQLPPLATSALLTLVNQSWHMQQQEWLHPGQRVEINTLFLDHAFEQPNGAQGFAAPPENRSAPQENGPSQDMVGINWPFSTMF